VATTNSCDELDWEIAAIAHEEYLYLSRKFPFEGPAYIAEHVFGAEPRTVKSGQELYYLIEDSYREMMGLPARHNTGGYHANRPNRGRDCKMQKVG
jgi:hypothetical protein